MGSYILFPAVLTYHDGFGKPAKRYNAWIQLPEYEMSFADRCGDHPAINNDGCHEQKNGKPTSRVTSM